MTDDNDAVFFGLRCRNLPWLKPGTRQARSSHQRHFYEWFWGEVHPDFMRALFDAYHAHQRGTSCTERPVGADASR